jgi:endonuclease/exonuclease/phosphatase family metal-dependent hydrolase
MNEPPKESMRVLQDYYELSSLIEKDQYSSEDKNTIVRIIRNYDGLIGDNNPFIKLNEIRGPRFLHLDGNDISINRNIRGRKDWIGWFELNAAEVNENAVKNTARVIDLVGGDVLSVVEVENRIAINKFNENVIPQVGGQKYDYTMVIDGNDDRGIDVGIMAKHEFRISSMGTHIFDEDDKGRIFMRDCAEYTIQTPSGKSIVVLVNHFKSQSANSPEDTVVNDAIRIREAKQVRKIYEKKLNDGMDYIAITGDLNQEPTHFTLEPLIGDGSSLQDVMSHEKFRDQYGLSWTHKRWNHESKLDYILLSPKLQDMVVGAGIERHGVWGIGRGEPYEQIPEMKDELDAASDHAALWVDLDM